MGKCKGCIVCKPDNKVIFIIVVIVIIVIIFCGTNKTLHPHGGKGGGAVAMEGNG
jgi:hypothetical protein